MHAVLAEPHVLFRHTASDATYGQLSAGLLDNPAGERLSAWLSCERVAFAGGQGLCLQADRGIFTTYNALLLDSTLQPRATLKLDGAPSRARISADGTMGAVTVFLAESHGYSSLLVSTKTSLIDMVSGDFIGDLEEFSTWRDGTRWKEADFNFWGVTFARDGKSFYASLQSGGRTFLVRGDPALRRLTVVHPDVECPSLSPDGTTIAFKRRLPGSPVQWRVYLLDVATMAERPLALETRSVDDQMEWLDSSRLLYAIPRPASPVLDVWVAPIDGSSAPSVFLPEAESPAIVRGELE
jgi:dipeptidyl aminopeptidase/acylaminoacyl peptidase